jgi:hypothetical protein
VNEDVVLRITTERHENSLLLRLEGRIEGPWVEVLRKTWIDAASRSGDREIAVDLGGVRSADRVGRILLLTMQKQGVELTGPSGFMRQVLRHEGAKLN